MPKVKIYTTNYCPFCDAAKALLKQKGFAYEEIDVSDPEKKMTLKEKTGWMTVPQIFIGEDFVGGYQELAALDQEGKLELKA